MCNCNKCNLKPCKPGIKTKVGASGVLVAANNGATEGHPGVFNPKTGCLVWRIPPNIWGTGGGTAQKCCQSCPPEFLPD